ncbi:hypothetical protein BBJ28_00008433 [Nothophytophthora sp. Chile5]|nr:hypothetical protein BBJ28_00008433 [Nothophytophthora sp. Chile5]
MAEAPEQDSNGWHEVEQTLTALELPPVPPTSDPQRLLGYVLHILPRYTEMEMLATHLRLYASTMEQDMEQVKSHVRLLTREAAGEREKKQFLERYAAQIVKERNDLLHSKGSSKKKAAAAAVVSHFVWHTCCKKNTSHALDVAPSILAFRGEKLQEATKQIEALQEEVHNQELLRKELDFLLKKTQREHDSKTAADRKHVQQLEKQLLQRAMLHSSLERKLYDVETALAKHDRAKEGELSVASSRVSEAQAHVKRLEKENAELQGHLSELSSERERLAGCLEEAMQAKDTFAVHIDELSDKCKSLESEVEALRSEIDVLQSNDINDVRTKYAARIHQLQQGNTASEQKLRQEIDYLKRELKKRDESLAQKFVTRQSTARGSVSRPPSKSPGDKLDISLSLVDAGWSDDTFGDDLHMEDRAVGSSLSRSQLSDSLRSFGSFSAAGQSHFDLSEEIGVDGRGVSARSDEQHRHEFDRDPPSGEQDGASEISAVTSTNVAPFDWETFIDSASEISTSQAEQSKRSSARGRATTWSGSHDGRSADLHGDAVPGTNVPSGLHSSREESSDGSSADDLEEQQQNEKESVDSFLTGEHPTFPDDRSLVEFEFIEEEEVKEDDKDDALENEKESGQESGTSRQVQDDLARDLQQMLNGLEQKRIEEEQKASQAEQALLAFQHLQQGLEQLQVSPNS